MSPLLKNLLIALGLAVLVWLGYILFVKGSDDLVTSTNGIENDAVRDGQELLVLLQQVRSVNLKGEVLEDARFQSLVDFRQDIVDEPKGRTNPFAPL